MAQDLELLVADLRRAGGDTTSVEVKSAAGGLPDTLAPTLSALANLPGGGIVILGLDERNGFRPVQLTDPQVLKQGLAAKARGFVPPVVLDIDDGMVDGAPEDGGTWTPVAYFSERQYGSEEAAVAAARGCVPWLGEVLDSRS